MIKSLLKGAALKKVIEFALRKYQQRGTVKRSY